MGLQYLSRLSLPHLFLSFSPSPLDLSFFLESFFDSTTNDNLRRLVTYIDPVQKLIIEFYP